MSEKIRDDSLEITVKNRVFRVKLLEQFFTNTSRDEWEAATIRMLKHWLADAK